MASLIELAEELSIDDITELLARKACLISQEFAKDRIDDEDLDEEDREPYRAVLSNTEAMTEDAQSYVYQTLFDHNELGFAVEEKIAEVAEEYVR